MELKINQYYLDFDGDLYIIKDINNQKETVEFRKIPESTYCSETLLINNIYKFIKRRLSFKSKLLSPLEILMYGEYFEN